MTDLPNLPALDNASVRDLIHLGTALNEQVTCYTADELPDAMTAIVPAGYQLVTLQVPDEIARLRLAPDRVKGTTTVTDVDAWLWYFKKYGTDASEVYGDVTRSELTAILNAPERAEPRWGDHRVTLKLTHSAAWEAWMRVDGKLMDQTMFAEHIEDRTPDMVHPEAADMLDVAQSIHATTEVHFQAGSRLMDGQQRFQYIEDTTGAAGPRGDMAIPTRLELQVQVWRGVPIAVPLTARFRYRPQAKGLRVGVVLDRVEDVLDAAWTEMLSVVGEGIPVPVLAGRAPVYS